MDYPYIIYIILILFFCLRSYKTNNAGSNFNSCVIITFLFIGLRACVVGADTYLYTLTFLGTRNDYIMDEIEPLYKIYNFILSSIYKNEVFFLLCNTFFSLFPLYLLINKFSDFKELSIALFFLLGINLSYFVALRQILALAILFLGIYYVIENKKRKWLIYAICLVAAYFMHHSTILNSILFSVLYFIRIDNRRIILSSIIVTAIMGVVMQQFNIMDIFNAYLNLNTGLTDQRLDKFISSDEQLRSIQSGFLSTIYNLIPSIVAVYTFSFLNKDRLNHWFSKIYLLSVIASNIFFRVDMFGRINLGFQVFSIIVITWAFSSKKLHNILLKKIFFTLIMVILLRNYFFENMYYDIFSSSRMHPYYFFFENYSDHPALKYFIY